MKSKRFLSMALIAALATSIAMTGCGNNGGNSSSTASNNGGDSTPLFTYDGNSAPVVNSDKPIKLT